MRSAKPTQSLACQVGDCTKDEWEGRDAGSKGRHNQEEHGAQCSKVDQEPSHDKEDKGNPAEMPPDLPVCSEQKCW